MNFEFAQLSDCVLSAFNAYRRTRDLIRKKQEIFTAVLEQNKVIPKNTLFIGFSPLILSSTVENFITCVSQEVLSFLDDRNIQYTYIPFDELELYHKKFDVVVAIDEFTTFASSESDQIEKVNLLASLAASLVITTIRDYKNLNLREREFSQPIAIQNDEGFTTFIEYHHYKPKVKNHWETYISEVSCDSGSMTGPLARRAMYFKQLAKFSFDAGATDFTVHKNLMYKGLIKKNHEHVISIKFN